MLINVTKEDIYLGEQESCQSCPVALAISRATGEAVSVTETDVRWANGNYSMLPKVASNFIRNYDSLDEMEDSPEPFSFDLAEPRPAATL